MKYNSETIYDLTRFEETTVGISPTNYMFEGIFPYFLFFYRRYEIFKRSTISLGVVAALLLVCCMMECFCCLKKRGEVYILRNREGIANRHVHFQNSDESIAESEAERGEYERQEQRRIHDQLQEWHAEQRANHKRATQEQRFSQNISTSKQKH